MPITLAIVDDQQLFRQGLASLIKEVGKFELLIEAESGATLLDQLQQSNTRPEILLMDMELPDMNGMQLNEILRQQFPSIKVIVVSMFEQERYIFRMIEAGACGYLMKNGGKQERIDAIEGTAKNGFYFNRMTMHEPLQA